MSSSSPVRALGTGLASLIPTSSDPDDVDAGHPAAAAGRRATDHLLQLRTAEVQVPVLTAAAELLDLLALHPDPVTREAVSAVVARLRAAVEEAGRGA